jgi:hypothetical protein
MAGGPNLEIEIRRGDGKTIVHIKGLVDELAELDQLSKLSGPVEVNLGGIRRFNSAGVRVWVDAMRSLADSTRLTFVECAPPVIDQLNMISGFLGSGQVESFYGQMLCPICETEDKVLFQTRAVRQEDRLPETRCPGCGGIMELDDDADQYLLFVREPTAVF